jgi:hypothetical protein
MPMNKTVLCVLLATATGAAMAQVPAGVDPGAVQRCRIIAEAAARLACYDAIALPGIGSRAGWGAPVAPSTAPTAGPTGTAAPAAGGFGFEGKLPEGTADRLDSRIQGRVQEFGNGTRFTLDNGQVWQIVDDTTGFYDLQNPPVRIERAVLGSFMMTIEGVNQRRRVRRIR